MPRVSTKSALSIALLCAFSAIHSAALRAADQAPSPAVATEAEGPAGEDAILELMKETLDAKERGGDS